MAQLIDGITHLPAPTGFGTIRLDRFSPYWRSPEKHGVTNLRQFWAYDLVYGPAPPERRKQLAYFFDYDHADGRSPETYASIATDAVNRWIEAYHRRHATLEIATGNGFSEVLDSRFTDEAVRSRLTPAEAALLKTLDGIVHRDAILAHLLESLPDHPPMSEPELASMLERFLQKAFIVREGDLYLSVVVDRAEYRRIIDRRVESRLALFGLADGTTGAIAATADSKPAALVGG
jgi:hypothetical protein